MPARCVACVVIVVLAGLACPAFAAPQEKPKRPDPVELWKTFPVVPKVRSGPQANDTPNPKPAPAAVSPRSSPTSPQPSPSSRFPLAAFIVFGLVILALLPYVVRKTYAEIRQPVDAQATPKSRPVAPEADRPPREAHERAQQLEAEVRQMQTAWREEMDEIETRLDTLIRGLNETRSQFEIPPTAAMIQKGIGATSTPSRSSTEERAAILAVLEDPRAGLEDLRGVLARDHRDRI